MTDKELLDKTFNLLRDVVSQLVDKDVQELLKRFVVIETEIIDNNKTRSREDGIKPVLFPSKQAKKSFETKEMEGDFSNNPGNAPWEITPPDRKPDPLKNIRSSFDDLPDINITKKPNPQINDLPWDDVSEQPVKRKQTLPLIGPEYDF
ncbi:MAG: hypothetical protein WC389_14540 [Lutibacter sp.]|jgi:hypothetical protein